MCALVSLVCFAAFTKISSSKFFFTCCPPHLGSHQMRSLVFIFRHLQRDKEPNKGLCPSKRYSRAGSYCRKVDTLCQRVNKGVISEFWQENVGGYLCASFLGKPLLELTDTHTHT